MTGATFHRRLFLGVSLVKYVCESMTILAPVHLSGVHITRGILVCKCDNQLTTLLCVFPYLSSGLYA